MNAKPELFAVVAQQLLVSLPMLAIMVAGGVIALFRWPRHPRVSLLLLCACGLSGLLLVGVTTAQMLVVHQMPERMRLVMPAITFVSVLGHVVSYSLFIAAAISDRPRLTAPGVPPVSTP